MFVSCYVHSSVTFEISGPGVCNFKFNEYTLRLCKDLFSSKKVTMAEWEPSAVVIVRIRVRTLLISLVWFEFLLLLVARASGLFASSEGYVCD